jgi:nitrate reductase gamma subunit
MNGLFQSLAGLPSDVEPFFYMAAGLAMLIFVVGVLQRMSLWQKGRDESYPLSPVRVFWLSFTRFFAPDCFFARRVFANSRSRGIMLSAIVWSVMLLAVGVATSAVTFVTNSRLGVTIDGLLGLAMDLAGGVLLLGLAFALARRFIFRPARYIPLRGDAVIMLLFLAVVLSGLVLEASHLAVRIGAEMASNQLAMLPPVLPPVHGTGGWAWYWQPFGSLIARIALALGVDPGAFEDAHLTTYLFHAASAFLLIAYLPFSKLFHAFAAQITTTARSRRPARGSYPLRSRG